MHRNYYEINLLVGGCALLDQSSDWTSEQWEPRMSRSTARGVRVTYSLDHIGRYWTSSQSMEFHLFFRCWETVYCGSPKNSPNDLLYPQVTAVHQWLSASAHASYFQQVCNLIFTESGAKINRQYYREVLLMQEMLQWFAALLEMRLSSSKTMHQHTTFMTWLSFCAMRHPTINRDMWPDNITDINPVHYHHLLMLFDWNLSCHTA